jgi:hypothetical protein
MLSHSTIVACPAFTFSTASSAKCVRAIGDIAELCGPCCTTSQISSIYRGHPICVGQPFVTIPSVVPPLDVKLQCLMVMGTFHLSNLGEAVLGAGGPWCLCGLSTMSPSPAAPARYTIVVCFGTIGVQCPFPKRVVLLPSIGGNKPSNWCSMFDIVTTLSDMCGVLSPFELP